MRPSETTLADLTDQPLYDERGGAWRAQEKLTGEGHGTGLVEFRPLNRLALSNRGEEGGEARPDPEADLSFEKPTILTDRDGLRPA